MNQITKSMLVGTWGLLSWTQNRGDEKVFPMGSDPVGTIIYTEDGFVSVNIMRRLRENLKTGDFVSASIEEKAAAFGTYLGYSGDYELTGEEVVHRITCASYPNWVGESQVRRPLLEGDVLTLDAAARIVNGVSITARLVWRRVRGH